MYGRTIVSAASIDRIADPLEAAASDPLTLNGAVLTPEGIGSGNPR